MAVARVSRLAVPRPPMKEPIPWEEPDAEAATLPALDQHEADERDGDEDVQDEQNGGHGPPLLLRDGAGNGQEVGRDQRGTADQRAIHIRQGQDGHRVGGFHRPAI